MKAICRIKAYYNGAIVKPGEIVDIKGKKLPSWASVIDNTKVNKENTSNANQSDEGVNEGVNKEKEEGQETNSDDEVNNDNSSAENTVSPFDAQELSGKTELELNAILDGLLTQALDKGIEIDLEKQSVIESIIELRQKLEGVNEGVNEGK